MNSALRSTLVATASLFTLSCGDPASTLDDDGLQGGASSGGATATGGAAGSAGANGGGAGRVSGGAGGASGASSGGSSTGGAGGVGTGGSSPGGAGGAGASGGAGTGGMGAVSGAAGSSTGGVGGSGGSGGSTGCGKMGKTGARQETMTAAGLERGYYLSVPQTYDSSVPNRLVFGYHGSNYTGIMMRQYLDNERAPLVAGTVFVYPDGLPLEGQPDHIAWELAQNSRDMVFFDELLAKLQSEYCIDPDRIFVNGQSYGGLMTNALGCFKGDVIRAIAVVAGSGPRGSSCQGQVAAWLTHGMDDDSVNFTSGEASRDHWVEANHCTTTTLPGMPSQCLNYQGCDAGYPVIWCPHVDDGGHQHPSFGRAAVREFLASF
jgi:poly(3-hydroxybutyrate) depolymerase